VGLQPALTTLWLSATGRKITIRQWGEADWVNMSQATATLFGITRGKLYQNRFLAPCDVRTANMVQLSVAFLVTLPMALLEVQTMQWTIKLTGALAWFVLALMLGGSSLLYLLIHRGATATVISQMYLVPLFTALIAWLQFSEPNT